MQRNPYLVQNLIHRLQHPRCSLNLILVAPFVIQIVLVVGVTGYLSLRNGQQAVREVVKQLRDETATRIERELSVHLTTAKAVNQLNVDGLEIGTLNVAQLDRLENYLTRQLQQFKEVTSITIATEEPDYIGLGYSGEDRSSLYLSIWNKAERGTLDWLIGPGGKRQFLRKDLAYDYRDRPWYRDTVRANQLIWNQVYATVTAGDLVISVSQPFYDKKQDRLLGIVSTDIALTSFSKFLRSLQIGQTGQAFILERSGLLIATSTDQPLIKPDTPNAELDRLAAIDSTDRIVSGITQSLIDRFGDFSSIRQKEQVNFSIDQERLFVQVVPFQKIRGIDWLVVVVVPEADFMAQINANTFATAWLCVGALVIAVGMGIVTSRWIAQPILRLQQASRSIAQGNFDQRVDTQIPVIELAAMAQSFNQMAEQMSQSLQEIEVDLSKSREKFIKVFRFGPDPIAITTFGEGRFITVNDSFLDWYGFSREEVIGNTCQDLHLWPDLEDYRTLVQLLHQQNLVRNLEVMHRTKAGEVRTILLSAEIADLDGQTCVISSIKNISERKQVEAELRQAKEAADAANKAKSEFLTNMSHELRTPLNAILGFSDLMRDDRSIDREKREHLNIIHHSGEYLLSLINDVLDLSKIEAGKISLHETSFDLHHLLESLEAMMQLKATSKGLTLVFDIADDIPKMIYADEGKLRQILINLLGNATKFTDSGSVILRVMQEQKTETVTKDQGYDKFRSANLLHFEVEDTGPGISETDIQTLFQPFTQTETGKLKQGTGLGLSISRKLIQLMAGSITVSSTLGRGSLFQVTLPIHCIRQMVDLQDQATRQVVGIKSQPLLYRILVVDDVRENRLLLTKILVPLGFTVFEAENGQQAIDCYQEHQPHLILMDMRMPVMDGYEATRRIKAAKKESDTIIFALTASAMEEHYQFAFEAGCDDFIAKPVKREILLTKLEHYLALDYVYAAAESGMGPDGGMVVAGIEHSISFYRAALLTMPLAWRNALSFAATACDVEEVEKLITQIPSTQAALAHYLKVLAHDFRLDQIRELCQ